MRELKFRCWNGEEMVCPDVITRNQRAFWNEDSIPTCSKIIMQYTGLHDKNGKEIYEGDIVCVSFLSDYTGKVHFESGCYLIMSTSGYNHYLNVEHEHCSVIGNIYENPELLERKV